MGKANFAYYPLYLAIFLGLTGLNFGLIRLQSFPALFVVILGLSYLALYKPKLFLFLAFTMMVTRDMFVMERIYVKFEFIGYGPGPTNLGFLRTVMPESKVYYNIPRAVFITALLRVLLLRIRKGSNALKLDKKEFAIFVFVVLAACSAVANVTFTKGTANFIVGVGMPLVFYYFIQSIKFKTSEKQLLIGYMLFVSLEVQVGMSLINNWYQVVDGNLFFGDFATGTFVFPLSEKSAYLIAMAFFAYLYRYLIDRKAVDLVRVGIAFYGILSISSVLFLLALVGFTFGSFALAYTMRVLKAKELALSVIAVLILAMPAVWIMNNPELYYDGEHAQRHIEESAEKEIWEIPKVYAFINLANMLHNERRYLFGSGPATFLTLYGEGRLSSEYGSYNVLGTDRLSSSQRVENSFVGLVGELGIFGYLAFLWFYFLIYKDLRRINRFSLQATNSPFTLAVAVVISMLFFFAFSFLRNVLEAPIVTWPLMIYASLVISEAARMKREYHYLMVKQQSEKEVLQPG